MRFLIHALIVGLVLAGLTLLGGPTPRAAATCEWPCHLPATGDLRVVAIAATFEEEHHEGTLTDIANMIWTGADSVRAYYDEASYGKSNIIGKADPGTLVDDVYGWYVLPLAEGEQNCMTYNKGISGAAMLQADDDIDYNEYDLVIVFLSYGDPIAAGCGGLRGQDWRIPNLDDPEPGEPDDMIRINNNIAWALDTAVHELAHGMAISPAGSISCGNTVSGYCDTRGDDPYTIMSHYRPPETGTYHLNAVQKDFLGWFDEGEVLEVTEGGEYTIHAIEVDTSPLALKLSPLDIYIEQRQAIGFDASGTFIETYADEKILIHQSLWDGGATMFLDATPGSVSPRYGADFDDSPIGFGESVCIRDVEGDNDVMVEVIDVTGTELTVDIDFGADCALTRMEAIEYVYGGPNATFEPSPWTFSCEGNYWRGPEDEFSLNMGFYWCTNYIAPGEEPVFEDINWYEKSLDAITTTLVGNGVLEGGGDFNAYDTATRAEAAVMSVVGSTLDINILPDPWAPHFTDVPADHWAYGYIETLYTYGVIEEDTFDPGCGEDCDFGPDEDLTESAAEIIIQGLADADVDDDGYSVGDELYIGTIIDDGCPETDDPNDEDPDAWPSDFNDDQDVNLMDLIGTYKDAFDSDCGDPEYNPRADLYPDCSVDLVDLVLSSFKGDFDTSCTP